MDLLSTAKVAAAGIAGAGGSGGAVYGTYYLITSNKSTTKEEQNKEVKETKPKNNKELLKEWLKSKKCTITVTVGESPSTTSSFQESDIGNDDSFINGLWTWLENPDNKKNVECDGTTSKTAQLKTTNKTDFQKNP